MSASPRPRHTYENGNVAVPAELRRAIIGRYDSIMAVCRAFVVSKYTAYALTEPYGTLEPDVLDRVIRRAEGLGIYPFPGDEEYRR